MRLKASITLAVKGGKNARRISLSPDTLLIVIWGNGNPLQLYHTITGQLLLNMDDADNISCLTWTMSSKYQLFLGLTNGNITVVDYSLKQVCSLRPRIRASPPTNTNM